MSDKGEADAESFDVPLDPGATDSNDESDLDYLSRPENYTAGSNFQAMQRVIVAKETKSEVKEEKVEDKTTPSQAFLYTRYRDIFPTDDEIEQMKKEKVKEERKDMEKESDASMILKIEIGSSPAEEKSESVSPESRTNSRGPMFMMTSPGGDSRVPSAHPRLSITPSTLDSSPSSIMKRGPPVAKSRTVFLSKDLRSKIARDRFRHAVRMVITVVKWAVSIIKKDKISEDSGSAFMIDKEYSYENLKNSGLHFDPNYFKAKVEINLSSEVKHILSLPSEQRTPEQIQTAMYGLRSLRSFAEYPLHMQEKLCKVAWFATVSPKRQIIRQGHLAENFYFILSGQAVVTILVKDPKTGESVTRTATIMRRGMSFGELALLHHSRRTATVTTQENVQLLTIGRDDFFDIFMSGTGPDQLPDHVRFAGQLEFMKHWPIERLLEHPEQCLLHFFKRSAVIVKDSLDSDWIYIVKSGSCQVIKTLKGVTPKLGLRKGDRLQDHLKLPRLGTGEQGPRINTGLRPTKKNEIQAALTRAVTQFDDLIRHESAPDCDEEGETGNGNGDSGVPEKKTGPGFSKSTFDKFKADAMAYCRKMIDEPNARLRDRMSYRPPRLKRNPKPKTPPKPAPPPNAKPPPVFVQVESLNPRDVFGLETVVFDNDFRRPRTTVSLVSRGAECIMLSKEFFAKNANEAVRQMMRKLMRPYPEEDTFQENLQTKEDWELYKKTLIADIVTLNNVKKSLNIPTYS